MLFVLLGRSALTFMKTRVIGECCGVVFGYDFRELPERVPKGGEVFNGQGFGAEA